MGTDVDTCLYYLTSGEGDGQFDVEGRGKGVVTVD